MHVEDTAADREIPVLEMIEPLPGFPDRHRFALVRLDDDGVVSALRSLDDDRLRFLVVPPTAFFAGYTPEIDDSTAEALEATTADDLLVLVLVSTAETAASATVNLRAPLVVNHRTRKARQVVLSDESLPLRAPLTPPTPEHTRGTQKVR